MSSSGLQPKAGRLYDNALREGEIRLLELLPGSGQEPIECRLDRVTLEKRAYEAISYTWSIEAAEIVCNGESFTTTENLRDALFHLRLVSDSRWLWADQVCINQDDAYEKDVVQVPMMAQIYQRASKVIIWLGKEGDNSDIAMDCFPRLVSDLYTPTPAGDKRIEQVCQYRSPESRALNFLLRRRWFTRVWTLQEVAVAHNAVVVCGRKRFDWQILELFSDKSLVDSEGRWTAVLNAITSAHDFKSGETGRFETAHVVAISRLKSAHRAKAFQYSKISDVRHLHRVRSCGATRPKDKILSLLVFLSAEMKTCLSSLENGVRMSTEEFYEAVTSFQLLKCHEMKFLGAAGTVQRSNQLDTMPTWVPDWSVAEKAHNLWLLNDSSLEKSNKPLYKASPSDDAFAKRLTGSANLQIKAKLIDTIDQVGGPPGFTNPNDHGGLAPGDQEGGLSALVNLKQQRYRHAEDCFRLAETCRSHYGQAFAAACRQTLVRGATIIGGNLRRVTDDEIIVQFDTFARNVQDLQNPRLIPAFQELQRILATGDIPDSFDFEAYQKDTRGITELMESQEAVENMQDAFRARVFFTTRNGYMGLGPRDLDWTKRGDKIAVISGCCAPFVIRPVQGETCYDLIGEAYVQGLMDGEAKHLKDIKEEILTLR